MKTTPLVRRLNYARRRARVCAGYAYIETLVVFNRIPVGLAEMMTAQFFKTSPRTVRRWVAEKGGLL